MREHRTTSPPEGARSTAASSSVDELAEGIASVAVVDGRLERACRVGALLAGQEAQSARLLASDHPNPAALAAALDRLTARKDELLASLSLLLTEARAEVARAIPHLEAGMALARTDHWTLQHLAEAAPMIAGADVVALAGVA